MELDFSKLDRLGFIDFESKTEAPETAPEATKTEQEEKEPVLDLKSLETASTTPERQLAYIKLAREQEDRARAREAYTEYQTNIREAGDLRSQILKGSREGEAPIALFLKACECISQMTGEKLFSEQVEQDLKAIYGEALLEPIPVEWEKNEVKNRLDRLQQALERTTEQADRDRIERAIQAHREKLRELEELLSRAEGRKEAV